MNKKDKMSLGGILISLSFMTKTLHDEDPLLTTLWFVWIVILLVVFVMGDPK